MMTKGRDIDTRECSRDTSLTGRRGSSRNTLALSNLVQYQVLLAVHLQQLFSLSSNSACGRSDVDRRGAGRCGTQVCLYDVQRHVALSRNRAIGMTQAVC
jgi:hypothetical protein